MEAYNHIGELARIENETTTSKEIRAANQGFAKNNKNISTQPLTWLTKRGIVIADIEQKRK